MAKYLVKIYGKNVQNLKIFFKKGHVIIARNKLLE